MYPITCKPSNRRTLLLKLDNKQGVRVYLAFSLADLIRLLDMQRFLTFIAIVFLCCSFPLVFLSFYHLPFIFLFFIPLTILSFLHPFHTSFSPSLLVLSFHLSFHSFFILGIKSDGIFFFFFTFSSHRSVLLPTEWLLPRSCRLRQVLSLCQRPGLSENVSPWFGLQSH